jgi:hypothetical protein
LKHNFEKCVYFINIWEVGMATQAKRNSMTKGLCNFCKSEIDKAKMTQHLKSCKQRAAINAANDADTGEEAQQQKEKLLHILVEGRYNPQYWMHLEIPASASLFSLDSFFRDIWVECCGHLSAFKIDGTSYADDPEDFSFEIVGTEDEEDEEDEEEEDEEEEDLSPEEFAEEMGKFLDEQSAELLNIIPDELQAELRKPHSRDELVALLKERLTSLPKPTISITPRNIEEQRSIHFQKLMLQFLLDMVEDRSLSVPLEKVLRVKQKFTYEYDFGSTTDLSLRVIAEREGVALQGEDDDVVFILARNEPAVIVCKVCGKPATKVVSGYFNVEANAYCNKCARRNEDEEMLLPVVNSPRVGVCGYTG